MAENTVKILNGSVEMDYKWSPGQMVGKFLTKLRDEKEINGVRCPKTSKVFLPPQAWSPYANVKMDRLIPLKTVPRLKAGTVVYEAPWNMPENISLPYMMAAVQFTGADTELIHLVSADEKTLLSLKPGDELEPVWKKDPNGTIRDIEYFVPKKGGTA